MILYAVRKYLAMAAEEWEALSWDMQQTYLDGLTEDPEVPFRLEQDISRPAGRGQGPVTRTADTGAEVFDLRAMINELERNPEARKRQRDR